jgi:hypothetical protein
VAALLAFLAALVSLRLSAGLVRRARERHAPELVAWAAALGAYAAAAAALAAGAAGSWHDPTFRVYYLCGGLLTVPLLALGSLLRIGARWTRWATPVALLYSGVAVGVALAAPLAPPVAGSNVPQAQDHLDLFPARVLAVVGNSVGTVVVACVALATLRRRPLGNALILAGVGAAALGTGVAAIGEAATAALLAVAAVLLYGGVASRR